MGRNPVTQGPDAMQHASNAYERRKQFLPSDARMNAMRDAFSVNHAREMRFLDPSLANHEAKHPLQRTECKTRLSPSLPAHQANRKTPLISEKRCKYCMTSEGHKQGAFPISLFPPVSLPLFNAKCSLLLREVEPQSMECPSRAFRTPLNFVTTAN